MNVYTGTSMYDATAYGSPSSVFDYYTWDAPVFKGSKIYVHTEGTATNPFFEIVGSMWETRITPWPVVESDEETEQSTGSWFEDET